jgi:hypothetical protein
MDAILYMDVAATNTTTCASSSWTPKHFTSYKFTVRIFFPFSIHFSFDNNPMGHECLLRQLML